MFIGVTILSGAEFRGITTVAEKKVLRMFSLWIGVWSLSREQYLNMSSDLLVASDSIRVHDCKFDNA